MSNPLNCDEGSLFFLNPACWVQPSQAEQDAAAKAEIDKASGGNAVMAAGAYQQYLQDRSALAVIQSSDPTPDPLGVRGFFSNLANDVQGAGATIGLVQIGFVAVAGFALYKIFSSDAAKSTLVEVLKK